MKGLIEGLLFVSGDDGLTLEEISNITEISTSEVKNIIQELYKDYENKERGIQIEFLGDHFKLTTKIEHKNYYKKLIDDEDSTLSQSALEVLAIIAYNAPITRVEIDEIRGVNSTYVIRKLLIRNLIKEEGRSELPGKPKLYNITSHFLDYFGLGSKNDLPPLEFEKKDENSTKNLFESKYSEDI